MEAYSDNGAAIACAWATKMDTLGDCSSFKRIEKANTGALVMPFASASGDICYVTDGGEEMVKAFSMIWISERFPIRRLCLLGKRNARCACFR